MSALSDSTTTTDSPFLILSPSLFSHVTILPSVIVDDRAGMKISRTCEAGGGKTSNKRAEGGDGAGAGVMRRRLKMWRRENEQGVSLPPRRRSTGGRA